jgi:phage shock protein A
MSGLIRRMTRSLKSGLQLLFEPAEDPRETFASAGQRQGLLLARVQEALARNTALRRRLERRIAQLHEKLPRLEARACQAVAEGRDDLARMSLEHQQLILIEVQSLEAGLREIQLEEGRIAMISQRLAAQVETLRVRQEMSAARYTAAESQVKVSEAISGVSRELADLGQAITQAEQNADQMQARAAALDQLCEVGLLDSSDPVGIQLVELDIERAVEERLAALKHRSDLKT